jgi:hypothetical protein
MLATRATLRRVLEAVLRSDSDLDAFGLDYFPKVHQRWTNGMDRVHKLTILLEQVDVAGIQDALLAAFPREAGALLGPPAPPSPSAPVPPASPPPVVAPAAAPSGDPALAELRARFQAGAVVVFAGAGISLSGGLPSWAALVSRLRGHPRARGAAAEARAEIDTLVQERKLIDALTALEACLGRAELCAVVEAALDDASIAAVPEAAMALAALGPRLRAVLTTNLDRFLERAFAGAWPMFPRATADVVQRSRYILKLHGTLEDRSTWVLTRAEYDRAMHADPLLRRAFDALYAQATLLFVGYGLADDDLDLALGWVRALAGGQAPRHFALMPAGCMGPSRRRQLEDAGVRIVEYATPGGSHEEMVRVLRSLA